MDTSTLESKRKWEAPNDPSMFKLSYPPFRAPRGVGQWDHWVSAMMMDARLNSTDRAVLTRLALHYNLKTGNCFPSLARVAIEAGLGEAGDRTVRRCLSRAANLGWIVRTSRRGGREKNQTNLYELTLPKAIRDVLTYVGPKLTIAGESGAWQVSQVTDGAVICGPFKDRANAESWVREHGPTGQMVHSTGQPLHLDRANNPPITGKGNREGENKEIESSLRLEEKKEGVSERPLRGREQAERPSSPCQTPSFEGLEGYTARELGAVREGISTHGYDTVAAVVGFARKNGYFLTPGIVAYMVRDGHVVRDGERISLPAA